MCKFSLGLDREVLDNGAPQCAATASEDRIGRSPVNSAHDLFVNVWHLGMRVHENGWVIERASFLAICYVIMFVRVTKKCTNVCSSICAVRCQVSKNMTRQEAPKLQICASGGTSPMPLHPPIFSHWALPMNSYYVYAHRLLHDLFARLV